MGSKHTFNRKFFFRKAADLKIELPFI